MSYSFATPWTVARQASLSMGFPRQEYWSGLPFPLPGGLPDPRIEPASPALQVNSLLLSHQRGQFAEQKNKRHRRREQMHGYGAAVGARNWETGIDIYTLLILGFPGGSEVRIHLQCRRCRFDPWVRKIPCLGNSMDK